MSIMFANTRTPGGGSSTGNLVEFKAGRSLMETGSASDKRKVVADKTKGTIFIKQSTDQLMHFCWKNREKGTIDLDLIIFPGETEFVRIKECLDGRVYMLKFKSADDHKLFWLQESKTDKDDEYAKKVNDLLNNPPSSRARGAGSERTTSNVNSLAALNNALIASNEDIGALGNMDQNQIMQLFSLMNAGGNADILPQLGLGNLSAASGAVETPKTRKERSEPAPTIPSTPSNKFDAAMLNQIISSLPSTSDDSGKKRQIELSKVLSRANVGDIVKDNAPTLSPHLPETGEPDELAKTVGSPQFQQAADFFGAALSSGQLGPALQHFDLDKKVIQAADKADLVHFCQELTTSQQGSKDIDAKIKEEADMEENAEQATKKKDDEMDLD